METTAQTKENTALKHTEEQSGNGGQKGNTLGQIRPNVTREAKHNNIRHRPSE